VLIQWRACQLIQGWALACLLDFSEPPKPARLHGIG